MKIGFDAKRAYHNTSGLGNYSRDLIRIMSHFYPQNQYLLYNPKPKKIGIENEKVKEKLPSSALWRLLHPIWRQKPIVNQLITDEIQIFHGLTGEIPRGIQNTPIKTVVTIHDLIFVRFPHLYKYINRKIYFNKFKYAADHSDLIIAISEQTKRDIVTYLKAPPERIKVIYQGCNAAYKKTYSKENFKRTSAKFNLPDNYILNVGTVEERKNLLNLVKAIKDSDINLVIVGNTKSDYSKLVASYIKTNNMCKRVFFLKNVSTEELAQIYQMAKIFVYPSIFEGFGIPILEALYSKTPVITSVESCFSEAGGPQSLYIDPENHVSIANAINQVLNDEMLQEKMAAEGFIYAQQFNDDVIAKTLQETYRNLLS